MKNGSVSGLQNHNWHQRMLSCIGGKHHKSQFPKSSSSRSKNLLDLVYSNVCGEMSKKSIGGSEYFLT